MCNSVKIVVYGVELDTISMKLFTINLEFLINGIFCLNGRGGGGVSTNAPCRAYTGSKICVATIRAVNHKLSFIVIVTIQEFTFYRSYTNTIHMHILTKTL